MKAAVPKNNTGESKLWKPPIVGIVAFLLMLFSIALSHTFMVLVERWIGQDDIYVASIFIGAASIVLLWYGVKSRNENFQTWVGFIAGLMIWMTWVEFFFMFYGRMNWGMVPRMDGPDGLHVSGTYPEYMVMGATVGLLMMMLVYYTFDKDTRCNMFLWFQKVLGLKEGLGPSTKKASDRNYAIITFMETIYVLWFCYTINLLCFDPGLVGTGVLFFAVNMATVFVALVWSGYCFFARLIWFRRVSTALRYVIAVGNIFWMGIVEVGTKWKLWTEIWVQPWNYKIEMSVVLGAFLVLILLLIFAPKKPSELGKER
ncbi:MAG: hypothetical protein QGH93_12565 [Gammaproteobacteria bacterium]|jgi:hypothetical protein|nr:hypothetical protein [Gammaproteobacteria bacterium]